MLLPRCLLTAGNGNAQIVVREKKTGGRLKTGKRPPLVLEEPYYVQQLGESPLWFARFVIFRDLGPERTITEVAKICHLRYSGVRDQSKEDKWDIRARAYDAERDEERRIAARKLERKRIARDLALVDAGKGIIAAEYRELVKQVVENRATTGLSFDELTSAFEKLVKLGRLLTGESTEHVIHETPAMQAEKKLRDAVHDIQLAIQERELTHPDESPEDRDRFIELRIKWGVEDYQIDNAVLTQAVLGHITTSQAEK